MGRKRDELGREQGQEKMCLKTRKGTFWVEGKGGKTKDEMMGRQKTLPATLKETGL